MMKQLMLAIPLMLLPTVAMAQHADHAKAPAAAKPAAEHKNFAQELIAAKPELNLTDAQIKQLDALSVKMDEHHKNMGAHHGNTMSREDVAKMESAMHTQLLAIFTEEQLVKVRPMMKAHMEKMGHMKDGAKKPEQHKH
jgi:hypothetical protein